MFQRSYSRLCDWFQEMGEPVSKPDGWRASPWNVRPEPDLSLPFYLWLGRSTASWHANMAGLGGVCVCLSLLLIDHPWTHSSLFSPSALRPWAISSPLDTYQSRYTRPQQRFQWKGSSRGQDYIRRRERKFCSWHYELWFQIHMIQGKIHVWFTTWPGVWSIGIVWTLAQVLET